MISLDTPLFIVSGEPASAEGANRPSMTLWGNQQVIAAHNHDTDYSASDHNHDADYSPLGHDHAADYAALTHNHDADYSAIDHDHDDAYSPLSHDHAAYYAALTHNHDTDYSAIDHNHDDAYAPLDHEHDLSVQTSSALILDSTNPLEPEAQAGKILLFGQQVNLPGDGNDANTILLVHSDTDDGDIIVDDESVGLPALAITPTNAQHSTAITKAGFGQSSIHLNDGYLSLGQLFSFPGQFAFDTWAYLTASTSGIFCMGVEASAIGGSMIDLFSGTLRIFQPSVGWKTVAVSVLNAWHHFALDRDADNNIRVFLDGVALSALSFTYAGTISGGGESARIGYSPASSSNGFGYFTEIRISNISRYATNFTPPTLPYGGGKSQVLKAKFETGAVVQLASML